MRRTRSVIALAVAAVAAVAAMPTTATAGDLVVPPKDSEARKVVEDYNAKNALNNAALSIEGQAAIEDPPIKTIDDGFFREYQGRGQTDLGDPFEVTRVNVFVPDQDSYPRIFFATERLEAPDQQEPTDQLLVFEQQSADADWKATYAASYVTGAEVPEVAVDNVGLATLITGKDASSLQVKPSKLATKLAHLWQTTADGGAGVAKPFEPGVLTTDAVNVFISELEALPLNEANVEFTFEPQESQPVCVGADGGGALCMFVINYTAVLDPTSGSFVQPDSRETLTGLVVPGEYGSVTFERSAIVLAAVPKKAHLARVDIVGFYNGLISAQTTPKDVNAPGDAV